MVGRGPVGAGGDDAELEAQASHPKWARYYAVLVGIVHVTSTKYTPCMINHDKCAASSDWKLATSQKTYV